MAYLKAENCITPLAQIVLDDKGLMREVNKLLALAELEIINIGNQIDAVTALRDTFIYLAEKTRENCLLLDIPAKKEGK